MKKKFKKSLFRQILTPILVFALFLTSIGITAQATEQWDIASSHIQERNLIKKALNF